MMEEPWSIPDYHREGKVDSKSSKRYKSSTSEGVTHPTKNKGKEKVAENFVNNKVSCKVMVLQYILVSAIKKG